MFENMGTCWGSFRDVWFYRIRWHQELWLASEISSFRIFYFSFVSVLFTAEAVSVQWLRDLRDRGARIERSQLHDGKDPAVRRSTCASRESYLWAGQYRSGIITRWGLLIRLRPRILDRNRLKQPNHLLLSNQGWVGDERAGLARTQGWIRPNLALSVSAMFWLLSNRW